MITIAPVKPTARSALPGSTPLTRPARLSEEVAGDLARRIGGGGIKPGERLPTEKMLGETFGVSRAVVREAIARLKADGLIETRQGSGAYVTSAPKSINLRFWRNGEVSRKELRAIYELRAMVEGAVAELAARRRNRNDLAAMRRSLRAMEQALADGSDGTEADDDFHIAIAAATRNPYVSRLVEFLGRHFSDTRKLAWARLPGAEDAPLASQIEHRALLAAIEAGDPTAARLRSLDHLRAAAARAGIAVDLGDDD